MNKDLEKAKSKIRMAIKAIESKTKIDLRQELLALVGAMDCLSRAMRGPDLQSRQVTRTGRGE